MSVLEMIVIAILFSVSICLFVTAYLMVYHKRHNRTTNKDEFPIFYSDEYAEALKQLRPMIRRVQV